MYAVLKNTMAHCAHAQTVAALLNEDLLQPLVGGHLVSNLAIIQSALILCLPAFQSMRNRFHASVDFIFELIRTTTIPYLSE